MRIMKNRKYYWHLFKVVNMCFRRKNKIKRNDIRFNFKHHHLAHVKSVKGNRVDPLVTSVFMSSKEFDEGKENIKMKKPLKIGIPILVILLKR